MNPIFRIRIKDKKGVRGMTTIAQSINESHLRRERHKRREGRGTAIDILEDVALFLAAPFIGLGFALFYGLVGLAVIACYGLKAFGVQCGLFSN